MTRVVLDRETLNRIGKLDHPVEFCDDAGRTLGFFKPLENRDAYRELEPLIGPEEITRRKQIREGRTLAEILADLEKRK